MLFTAPCGKIVADLIFFKLLLTHTPEAHTIFFNPKYSVKLLSKLPPWKSNPEAGRN